MFEESRIARKLSVLEDMGLERQDSSSAVIESTSFSTQSTNTGGLMLQQSVRTEGTGLTKCQSIALVALQIVIGWHFLYEGLSKLLNPYWSSAYYLSESKWWLGGVLRDLSANPTAVATVDFLNAWGLTLIGLAIFLGLLARPALIMGMVLLLLYYIAAPPLPTYAYAIPAEGSYLVVNKILIELVAMVVLYVFPTNRLFGLDRLFPWNRSGDSQAGLEDAAQ
jgi:thiosulfate dehydrogenase [quinone] large subunit